MSIPIHASPGVPPLSWLNTVGSPQSATGSQTSAFSQLITDLDQNGTSSAPAPGSSSGLQNVLQSQGATATASGPPQVAGTHHGHHRHGGGAASSSWLTDLLNNDSSSPSTSASATGANSTSTSLATAAYAGQQWPEPLEASSDSVVTRNLLAVG
jgi:hypothetical protein